MKKILILAMSAVVAASCAAAPKRPEPKPVPKDHVPVNLEGTRTISPKAVKYNHVLFVNVGGAVPDDLWPLVSNYAGSRVNINIWTNSIAATPIPELVKDPAVLGRMFGPKASLAVFIENKPDGPAFLNAPGAWSMVNVRSVTKGSPDAQTLKDRYAKMLLKGLAYACGGGASLDNNCSLFYGSFSLEGLDATGIRISPMSYFPMIETLRAIGGGEITNTTYDEE